MKEQKVKKILEKFNDHRRIRTVLKLFKAEHLSEEEALEMILTDEQFHRQPEPLFPIYQPSTNPYINTPYFGPITTTVGANAWIDESYVGTATPPDVRSSSDNTT